MFKELLSRKRVIVVSLCAVLALLVSASTLIGRFFDSVHHPDLKRTSAITFVIFAIGLLLTSTFRSSSWTRFVRAACGIVVYLIGLLTLSEFIFGFEIENGGLLSAASIQTEGKSTGRMSPHAALNFILLGISLLLLGGRPLVQKISEYLTIAILITTYAALLGYLYEAEQLYSVSGYSSMGLLTAGLFVVLSVGLLCANPGSKLVKLLGSKSLGGTSARRLLPAVILIPTLIGWLRVLGQDRGLYDTGFGSALSVFTCVVLMFVMIFYYSATVHRIDLQRKKAEEDLAERERGYRDLFDHGQGLVCVHDVFGTITAANPAAFISSGYSREEIIGQSLRELLHEEQRPEFDAYLRKVVNEGEANGLLSVLTKRGNTLFWRYHNVFVCEPDKEPYVLGHAQDVTQLIEAQRALKNLSLTDELTGLYNRRGFLTFAEQQVKLERHESSARGLVLLFADLDGLKKINDNYGHEEGSEAISAFSSILKSCLRASDLIARWGGDEFVILSIGSSDKNAGPILERINDGVSKYNAESDKPYKLACSIGFTTVDGGGWKSLEGIIAEADTAMYAEKRTRKVKSGTAA